MGERKKPPLQPLDLCYGHEVKDVVSFAKGVCMGSHSYPDRNVNCRGTIQLPTDVTIFTPLGNPKMHRVHCICPVCNQEFTFTPRAPKQGTQAIPLNKFSWKIIEKKNRGLT